MEKNKHRFNSHKMCANPDTEVFYSKGKSLCIFEYAEIDGGWVGGHIFNMTHNTTEAYGISGSGCWHKDEPTTFTELKIKLTNQAIQFFSEEGRVKLCTGILKALQGRLDSLKKEAGIEKIFEFNEHKMCINPDKEIIYSAKDQMCEFEYALKDNNWYIGFEFSVGYSYSGATAGYSEGRIGYTKKEEATLALLNYAIRFFTLENIPNCLKVLKDLQKVLSKGWHKNTELTLTIYDTI